MDTPLAGNELSQGVPAEPTGSSEFIPRNAIALAALVATRPRAVVRDVARAPSEMVTAAKNRLVSSEVTGRGHLERAFDAAGLQRHLVNHLAYKSPMNGSKIRVDPAVEDAMFHHRTRNGDVYTPAPRASSPTSSAGASSTTTATSPTGT